MLLHGRATDEVDERGRPHLRRHDARADERRVAHALRHAAGDRGPGPLGAHHEHRAPRRDRQPHPGPAARLALADRPAIRRVGERARLDEVPELDVPPPAACGVRIRERRGDRPLPRSARSRRRVRVADPRADAPAARTATTASTRARIDDERGGGRGLRALVAAAQAHGLGLLVDIVPNHLATNEQNRWWWDVLRRGRDSPHAAAFDIDWDAPGLDGKLLLPVLGEPLDEVLDGRRADARRRRPARAGRALLRASVPARRRDRDAAAAPSCSRSSTTELADWREAAERINYRRFFDIADLVSLRQEDAGVFDATHARSSRLSTTGR